MLLDEGGEVSYLVLDSSTYSHSGTRAKNRVEKGPAGIWRKRRQRRTLRPTPYRLPAITSGEVT